MQHLQKHKSKKFSIWTCLGLIIAFVSMFFTVYVYFQPVKLPKKELTCTLVDTKNLILRLTNDKKFKIIYGEKEIKNPYVTIINVHNSGAYTINNADFKIPFSIKFTGSEKILSINVDKASNQYIADEVISNSDLKNQQLKITNFMLNANESFNINIVSDGKINDIHFGFRLAGISELKLIKNYESKYFVVRRQSTEKGKIFPIYMISIVGIFSLLLIIILIVAQKREKKNREKFYSLLQEKQTYKVQ